MAKPPASISPGGFVLTRVAHMFDNQDLEEWKNVFERRSIGRTRILKGALLFFSEKTGVHSCSVRDVTNLGAGIRVQDLKAARLRIIFRQIPYRSRVPSGLAPRRFSRHRSRAERKVTLTT